MQLIFLLLFLHCNLSVTNTIRYKKYGVSLVAKNSTDAEDVFKEPTKGHLTEHVLIAVSISCTLAYMVICVYYLPEDE